MALKDSDFGTVPFIPIPSSKAKGDPLYDDRIVQMLGAVYPQSPLDCREIIVQTKTLPSSHGREIRRPRPSNIKEHYSINQSLTQNLKPTIALVDDVLFTGAHFQAAKSVLQCNLPNQTIIDLFLTRRRFGLSDDLSYFSSPI
ncbi:MAG: hypothetical protein OXC63_13045 [Aestuariivita sp.]|nr:hypothetical protein [Aestuariivita sp.]